MEKLIDLIQDIRDNEIWMSRYFDKGKNKVFGSCMSFERLCVLLLCLVFCFVVLASSIVSYVIDDYLQNVWWVVALTIFIIVSATLLALNILIRLSVLIFSDDKIKS
jgi:hypothetical protein